MGGNLPLTGRGAGICWPLAHTRLCTMNHSVMPPAEGISPHSVTAFYLSSTVGDAPEEALSSPLNVFPIEWASSRQRLICIRFITDKS